MNVEYLETLGHNLYAKTQNKVDCEHDATEKARIVVNACEEMVCVWNYPMIEKIEWIEFTIYNLLPMNHYYKDNYRTLKEIVKASESNGFAVDNKRLQRLMHL